MKSLLALALCLGFASAAHAQNWPSFRGQNSAGVADGIGLPTAWDAEKSINILVEDTGTEVTQKLEQCRVAFGESEDYSLGRFRDHYFASSLVMSIGPPYSPTEAKTAWPSNR
jgi:hypothetical protein